MGDTMNYGESVVENDHKALAVKARKIYNKRLKQTLEPNFHGQFVAIEADSGDYFLGATPLGAIKSGKLRYADRTFHVMKVGYKAAILLKRRSLQWEPR